MDTTINSNQVYVEDDFHALEKITDDIKNDNQNGNYYTRKSLYRNFDPLVSVNQSFAETTVVEVRDTNVSNVTVNCTPCTPFKRAESDYQSAVSDTPLLMDFNTPAPRKMRPEDGGDTPGNVTMFHTPNASPKPDVLISTTNNKAAETIKLLRVQELALQEQLIKKDQEICKLTSENESYKQKCADYFGMVMSLSSSGVDIMHSFGDSLTYQDTEKQSYANKINALMKERDQALEDVQGVENSFAELHRRYEKMKSALEMTKQNEELIMRQCCELQEKLKEKDELYETLKLKADSDAYNANALVENAKKSTEREITVLRAQLKKAEMKVNGLQSQIDQKNEENSELTQMIDELTKLKC
ncbi:transforming acidic coiled-coil-containing protein 3-like protein [Leptotrombidium deliense]|uniref:Transforming acidic coiled-coil-containing protein 3-like protein n=1 Tax=Leptotrombidium deliense TaxID=299467 RepID=A0A443SQH0_9ACAR|nr:transforming acidic coiled-coil-containing protein 3-like protein [Leptotrombidium deliense]